MKTDVSKKKLAIKLRRKGKSIREIEKIINVSRSTLSGWLRNVGLSKKQKDKLHDKWMSSLTKARLKAAQTNRNKRLEKIKEIRQDVERFISKVAIDKALGELVFSIFYLAEGTKKESSVVIANSNPQILKAFLNLFRYLYQPDKSKFRCCLHLRRDQEERKLKDYWSRTLDIPESQFLKTRFDKRTIKPSFKNYKGVCVIFYYDINIQRRILYIGERFLQMVNKN